MSRAHLPRRELKVAQLKARLQIEEARLKHARRKADLRRRILIGAWIIARHGQDVSGWDASAREDLGTFLTRPTDRDLFGLGALE
jgi:hypothetical protein